MLRVRPPRPTCLARDALFTCVSRQKQVFQVRNLRQLADEVVKIEQQTNHESMMTFELVNGDVVVIPVEEAIEANEEIMKRNKIAKRMNFRE